MTTTNDDRSPTPHRDFAGRVALATLVVLGILALVAIVWAGRLIVALLFFAIVIASAIRPSVEAMKRRRVPRGAGVLLHYALFFGLIALGLWLLIPAAIDQVQAALGPSNGLREEAQHATGIKQDVLVALDRRLHDLPSGSEIVDPAVEYGRTAFEVIIGTFFVFATAAYWLVERDRAIDLVCSVLPRPKRKTVRDTWELIDLRLGAFVRGQAVLIVIVAAILSAGFWAIGLPYWLLVGAFAGLVEIVPVIGPLVAGIVAIGVGFPFPRISPCSPASSSSGFGYLRTTSSFPGSRAFGWPLAACRPCLGYVGRSCLRRLRRDSRGAAREHHRHALRHRRQRQGSGRGGRSFRHLSGSGFRVAEVE